ncbi:MAG: neocarzinostatin apoprotein domain-containing protein [Acidimicrobiales bacterium]
MIRRLLVFSTVLVVLLGLISAPAFADHGVAHNGETADVSKTEGLVQDQVVTVTGHGYEPGATLTVVQCFRFPAKGPADCELSNYGQYVLKVGADGSASIDYAVNVVDGRCDATTPCFIVVSDGIGAAANAVGTEVTFAEVAPATTTAPITTAAPAATTAAPAATADVSKTEGLAQDQVVTVTGHGYESGATLTVVQCFRFPVAGPADCELSNYGQYTAEVGADGSASIDYAVNVVEGRCDATTPCFIVVSDGIGAAANAVGTEVTFAEGTPATTTAPTTTAAPATTTAAPATTAVPVEADTATDDEGDSEAAAGNDETETDGGGLPGWVIPLAIAVVVVGAALVSRKKK